MAIKNGGGLSQLSANHILKIIRDIWRVEEGASESFEGGFNWWPGHHKVTVRCQHHDNPVESEAWRVVVDTDYIKDVDFLDPKTTQFFSSMGVIAPTYSMSCIPPEVSEKYDLPLDGKIWFHSSMYISPETIGWLPAFFAQLTIMQPIDTERWGLSDFARMMGGIADTSGPRTEEPIDDILNVAHELYVPIGKERCRWHDSTEFKEIAERFGRTNMCFGNGDSSGLTLETPFGNDSALIIQRTDVNHPALGSGLLSAIQLPCFDTFEATAGTCMWLNFLASRSWTDAPVLASWHPKEIQPGKFAPACGVHIPNALYAPLIATNIVLWSLGLVRWVRQAFWPDLEDRPMDEILAARFKI